VAHALAREGWSLALCGRRDANAVADALASVRALGADADYISADVAVTADRTRLIEAVLRRFGAIDALVNNAGRAPRVRADLLEATESSFEEIVRTNLQGPYFLTQRAAPYLVARKRAQPDSPATVVFVTSVSATMVSPARGEYCVSKAGLAMAAQLFAVRLAPEGVRVYDVRPGIIATDMTASVRAVYDQRIAAGLVPEGGWGQPEDVGRVVASLLRGDLPYATGSVIHVDGGLSIPRL
jgi:NAD(P)-dependent dehydrogenase (short-subunit alcohol dehydrogenase family)